MDNNNLRGFINCVKRRLPENTPFNIVPKYSSELELHPTIKNRAITKHTCNEIQVIIYSFGKIYDTESIFNALFEVTYHTGIKINLCVRYQNEH